MTCFNFDLDKAIIGFLTTTIDLDSKRSDDLKMFTVHEHGSWNSD